MAGRRPADAPPLARRAMYALLEGQPEALDVIGEQLGIDRNEQVRRAVALWIAKNLQADEIEALKQTANMENGNGE